MPVLGALAWAVWRVALAVADVIGAVEHRARNRRKVLVSANVDHVECGNCPTEAWGFRWDELVAEGWERNTVRGGTFHLCPDCVRRFAESRRLDRLLKLEPAR